MVANAPSTCGNRRRLLHSSLDLEVGSGGEEREALGDIRSSRSNVFLTVLFSLSFAVVL